MAVNGKEESFRSFIDRACHRFKQWDEATIKQLLRKKFDTYDPKKEKEYVAWLSETEAAQFAASAEETERRKLLAEEQYGPEYCPYCGEKTHNECGWWSQKYRMPGWRCSSGGVSHFLRWARENRR